MMARRARASTGSRPSLVIDDADPHEKEEAVERAEDAQPGHDQGKDEHGPRRGQNGDGRADDRDLKEDLGELEVAIAGPVVVSLMLELLGVLLDVLLLRVVTLLLLGEPRRKRLLLLLARAARGGHVGELRLHHQLLGPAGVLPA